MTDAEQDQKLVDLEARLARFEDFFRFVTNPHTGTVGVGTMGPFGVQTSFWMKRPQGQGAALSVGTEDDRYGIYAEVEAGPAVSHDVTAISARADSINPNHVNRAVEAIANNSNVANVAIRAEGLGIELGSQVAAFYIGKALNAMKRLWP